MASPLDLIHKARAQSGDVAPDRDSPESDPAGVRTAPAANRASTLPPVAATALVAAAAGSNRRIEGGFRDREEPFVVKDYDLNDAKNDATKIAKNIANSKAGILAMQFAALGIKKASNKMSEVVKKASDSYGKGRDMAKEKTQNFTTKISSMDTEDSDTEGTAAGQTSRKDSAVSTIKGVIESDVAKAAMMAGAHAFVTTAGSKVGIPPTLSNLAAAEVIESGVDFLQQNSSDMAANSVEFGISALPDVAGVIGGVALAAVDTLPSIASEATASAVELAKAANRLASESLDSVINTSSQDDYGGEEPGPEISVVEENNDEDAEGVNTRIDDAAVLHTQKPVSTNELEAAELAGSSSSDEEQPSDISDNEEWEDAR